MFAMCFGGVNKVSVHLLMFHVLQLNLHSVITHIQSNVITSANIILPSAGKLRFKYAIELYLRCTLYIIFRPVVTAIKMEGINTYRHYTKDNG